MVDAVTQTCNLANAWSSWKRFSFAFVTSTVQYEEFFDLISIFKSTNLFSWNTIRPLVTFSTFHSPFLPLWSIPAARNGASCIDVFDTSCLVFQFEHESLQSVPSAWNVSPREYLALLSIHDNISRRICNILQLIHWPTVNLTLRPYCSAARDWEWPSCNVNTQSENNNAHWFELAFFRKWPISGPEFT